jgi:ribosomal protein S18 acetylase RimI-like enzyme
LAEVVKIERIAEPSPLAPQVAEVYRSAFSIFSDGPRQDEVRRFSLETLPEHAQREGFRFLTAVDGEELVGFIYGYHGQSGEWWEDWIHERVSAAVYAEWFTNQFDVTEFCVRVDRQDEGIGSRLYDALFAEVAEMPYERAVLTTRRIENPARGFYSKRGWEVIWDALDDRFSLLGLRLSSLGD